MDIKNYVDLTDFIYDEFGKIQENLGVKVASEDFVKFNEKSLKKYVRLYEKPLYRKAKRDLQLQEAIDTMPHGFLWKFFHYDLWQKVKIKLNENQEENLEPVKPMQAEQQPLYPMIVSPVELPVVNDD